MSDLAVQIVQCTDGSWHVRAMGDGAGKLEGQYATGYTARGLSSRRVRLPAPNYVGRSGREAVYVVRHPAGAMHFEAVTFTPAPAADSARLARVADRKRTHADSVRTWQKMHGAASLTGTLDHCQTAFAAQRHDRVLPPPYMYDDNGDWLCKDPGFPEEAVRRFVSHCLDFGVRTAEVRSSRDGDEVRNILHMGAAATAVDCLRQMSERSPRIEVRACGLSLSWFRVGGDSTDLVRGHALDERVDEILAKKRQLVDELAAVPLDCEVETFEGTGRPCGVCIQGGHSSSGEYCPAERDPETLEERTLCHWGRWTQHEVDCGISSRTPAGPDQWRADLDFVLRDPPPLARDGRGRAEGLTFERYRQLLMAAVEREVPRLDAPRSVLRRGLPTSFWVEAAAQAYKELSK